MFTAIQISPADRGWVAIEQSETEPDNKIVHAVIAWALARDHDVKGIANVVCPVVVIEGEVTELNPDRIVQGDQLITRYDRKLYDEALKVGGELLGSDR